MAGEDRCADQGCGGVSVTDESLRNLQVPVSKEQSLLLTELQSLESDFIVLCGRIGKSRELSLAVTNMEQAAMWAARHVLGATQ